MDNAMLVLFEPHSNIGLGWINVTVEETIYHIQIFAVYWLLCNPPGT